MIGKLFAPLAMKVAGGIVAVLLIAIAFLWLNLAAEKRSNGKLQRQLSTANAMIEVQNAGIASLKVEADRRKKAAQDALQRAKQGSAKAEAVARLVEAPAPLSGKCETPKAVLSAEL
jgi:hypothetical protein